MQNESYDSQNILRELQDSYWEGIEEDEARNEEGSTLIYVLIVKFADSFFALDLLKTKEILKVPLITPIPRSTKELLGLINLRGHIRPVYDIRKLLSLPKTENDEATRLIMLNLDEQQVGILADKVLSIHEVQKQSLQQPLVDDLNLKKQYILGKFYLNRELVLLLDIEKVFLSQELTKVHLE